jgi:hypothetical protein
VQGGVMRHLASSLGLLGVAWLSLWDAVTCQDRHTGAITVGLFAVCAIVFAVAAARALANGRP